MNTSTSQNAAAEERASYWAARLDGSKLSPADQVALDRWLAEKPSHRSLLSTYCQFSADLELVLPALAENGMIELPSESLPKPRTPYVKWAGATALAAAALIMAGVWLAHPRTQLESIATTVAQRQTLTLADGSKAELNAQTSLQIEMSATERRVRLASGEACFTVTKEKARPFIVETPAGAVRVTGTVFNVRTESPTRVEVVVVDGSVKVLPGEYALGRPVDPVALTGGDQLSAGPDGVTVQKLSASALDDVLAWRHGQIVFANVPLNAVLARFARYHGRGITAAPEVADLRVGGRFGLDDLDGFLQGLEVILPVRVTRGLSGAVQVGPNNSRAEPPDRGNP